MQVSVVAYVEGMQLDITAGRITIVYDGDLEIEVEPGRELDGIRALGDLRIRLPAVTGDLVAGGRLEVLGDVTDGGRLQGKEVILDADADADQHQSGKPSVKCRVISADDRIVIEEGHVVADAMIAPRISLDARVTGRVTVIESRNERGPTRIKGGLSLAEYEQTFGGAEAFMAENGLAPLAPGPLAPTKEEEELHAKLIEAFDTITACYVPLELPLPVEQLGALIESRDYDALRTNIDSVWNDLMKVHQKQKIRDHHQVIDAFNLIHMLIQV